MPALREEGAEAERVIPMEVTLAFGVLFSALVILVLVPVFYLILADIRRGVKRLGKLGHSPQRHGKLNKQKLCALCGAIQ